MSLIPTSLSSRPTAWLPETQGPLHCAPPPPLCPCGGEFEGPVGSPGGNGRQQTWVIVGLTPWGEMELKRLQVMGQHRANTKGDEASECGDSEGCRGAASGLRKGRGEAVHRQVAVSEPSPCPARARPVSPSLPGAHVVSLMILVPIVAA